MMKNKFNKRKLIATIIASVFWVLYLPLVPKLVSSCPFAKNLVTTLMPLASAPAITILPVDVVVMLPEPPVAVNPLSPVSNLPPTPNPVSKLPSGLY